MKYLLLLLLLTSCYTADYRAIPAQFTLTSKGPKVEIVGEPQKIVKDSVYKCYLVKPIRIKNKK